MTFRFPGSAFRFLLRRTRSIRPSSTEEPATQPPSDDAAGSSRSAADLLGYGLAMIVALSLVALLVVLAAPAASGCGSRQVGRNEHAAAAVAAAADADTDADSESDDETIPPAAAPPAAAATRAEPAPAPLAATPPPPLPSPLVGDYECRFARGDRELRPVPCSIQAASDGALYFDQAGGAVRLSGRVTEDEAGFRLSGEVICAVGPCPGPGSRDLLFFSQGQTAYSAVLPLRGGAFLNIDLIRKP